MTETKATTGQVTTSRGNVVTIVRTESEGLPHVTFTGGSGTHTICVADHFGGSGRALGHAEGFLSDATYGLDRAEWKALARQLVGQVMDLPAAPAPLPARAVRFEFSQTESTGRVRVVATVVATGRRYLAVSAGPGRRGDRMNFLGNKPTAEDRLPWALVRAGLPKVVAAAVAAEGVADRAARMADRWKSPKRGR